MKKQMRSMTSDDFEKLLPDVMRDFHDQKDLFKAMFDHYSANPENKIPVNWVDGHIFTLDFFLWFMAQHGYRLQKFTSKKFQQYDLSTTVEHYNSKRSDSLLKILSTPSLKD